MGGTNEVLQSEIERHYLNEKVWCMTWQVQVLYGSGGGCVWLVYVNGCVWLVGVLDRVVVSGVCNEY